MTFLTLTRGLRKQAYFNTSYTDLSQDRFCHWIVVFAFTTTLGANLGNNAVIFQGDIQEVKGSFSFCSSQIISQRIKPSRLGDLWSALAGTCPAEKCHLFELICGSILRSQQKHSSILLLDSDIKYNQAMPGKVQEK